MNIPFTQTKEYLNWHEAVGEKTFYKEFFDNQNNLLAVVASVIVELRIGKVLYVPYGPTIFPSPTGEGLGVRPELSKEMFDYLQDLAKKENCVFVRLEEPEKDSVLWGDKQNIYPDEPNLFQVLKGEKLVRPPKKSFAKEGIFQPRVEWWLNLSDTEENLLNKIHKDHRYSIRRAQKENIQVEIVKENLEKYFAEFWKLLKETGERDGFGLYDENYYKQIFIGSEGAQKMEKFLVFNKYTSSTGVEKYMSVALVVVNDKVANLVFAGSVSEKRELGFNHLMQWEAIKKAKEMGCKIYNFGGIYENGYGKEGLQGVTNFKKRFGGFVKFHGDFVDIPIKKLKYLLYLAKKML